MVPYTLQTWSWLSLSSMANQKISRWGWYLHTVRGDINPDGIRVGPQIVGVVDVWMDSDPGMWPYHARVTTTLCMNPGK